LVPLLSANNKSVRLVEAWLHQGPSAPLQKSNQRVFYGLWSLDSPRHVIASRACARTTIPLYQTSRVQTTGHARGTSAGADADSGAASWRGQGNRFAGLAVSG